MPRRKPTQSILSLIAHAGARRSTLGALPVSGSQPTRRHHPQTPMNRHGGHGSPPMVEAWRGGNGGGRRHKPDGGPNDGPNMSVDRQAVRRHLAEFVARPPRRRGLRRAPHECHGDDGHPHRARRRVDSPRRRLARGAAFELAGAWRSRSTTSTRRDTQPHARVELPPARQGLRQSGRQAYTAPTRWPGWRVGARLVAEPGPSRCPKSRQGVTMSKTPKGSGHSAPNEDMKKKFREALDRKHAHGGKDVSEERGRVKVDHAREPRPTHPADVPPQERRLTHTTEGPSDSDGPSAVTYAGGLPRRAPPRGRAGWPRRSRCRPGVCPHAPPSLKDGPAMSMWAHGMPSPTNSCRNRPAVSMPPQRSPLWASRPPSSPAGSAGSFGNGIGHAASPAPSAAARTVSRKASSLAMIAATRAPRATIWAPVRVAMSTMASGLDSLARHRPSPSTMRPSASVSLISTVVPSRRPPRRRGAGRSRSACSRPGRGSRSPRPGRPARPRRTRWQPRRRRRPCRTSW